MFSQVFDHNITDESMEQKLQRVLQEQGLKIEEKAEDLKVFIKGKQLKNLNGSKCLIFLVDHRYLIIKDSTPFKNIHAFDLEGNWLWDIETCRDENGEPVEYFQKAFDVLTDEKGIRQLALSSFPVTFLTELETGKNTRIWQIKNDTNYK